MAVSDHFNLRYGEGAMNLKMKERPFSADKAQAMENEKASPHVPKPHELIIPFPAQGHINAMLSLARVLSLAGIQVTFLNTDYIHKRLISTTPDHMAHQISTWTHLRFRTMSDGLLLDKLLQSADRVVELFHLLKSVMGPILRGMLQESDDEEAKVTVIVANGLLTFAMDVADEVGIPILVFRTASACNFWACFCGTILVDTGDLPLKVSLLG